MAFSSTLSSTPLSTTVILPPTPRFTFSSHTPKTLVSFPKPPATAFPRLRRSSRCFARRGVSSSSSSPIRSRADEALISSIESELRTAVEDEEIDQAVEIPDGFPFKIEDEPGKQLIRLRRKYSGETIVVEVSMPVFNPSTSLEDDDEDEDEDEDKDEEDDGEDENEEDEDEDENEEDEDEDENEEDEDEGSIPLVVMVSKKTGPTLEFNCTAYSDDIAIDSVSLRCSGFKDIEEGKDIDVEDFDVEDTEDDYEGPDFSDLDERLQKAFRKYLEVRGIKVSMVEFLFEYMSNKESKEYFRWLNGLKKFIAA